MHNINVAGFLWKRLSRIKLNSAGMSLVEVMIVVGIISVTAIAFASMVKYMNNELKNSRTKADALSMQLSIQSVMKDQFSCTRTMINSGVDLPGTLTLNHIAHYSPSSPTTPTTSVIPADGLNILGNPWLNIDSMRLTAPSNMAAAPIAIVGTTNAWAADLVVTMRNIDEAPAMRPFVIAGIQIQTDVSGNVLSCKMGLSVICLTGYGDMAASGGILSADPGFFGTYNDVFSPFSDMTSFGVNCRPGWKMTGCSASGLKAITSIRTLTPTLNNGCEAQQVAGVAGVSRVYTTCCSQ